MNRIKYIILFLGLIVINGLLHCSLNNIAGGGTEDGNPIVISGIILNSDGTPASDTQVKLISSSYNPVNNYNIPNSQIDTTNQKGQYALKTAQFGMYNILALDLNKKTQLIIKEMEIGTDTFTVPTDTLKQSGSLYLRLSDSINEIGGYLYVKGTDIFIIVDSTALKTRFILIGSVPAGEIPNIIYTNENESVLLTDSVNVVSGATVHHSELTDIYYSVGANTEDLKSGLPLITISSGTASFSESQPDNIGVGDVVTYGLLNNKVFICNRTSNTQYSVITAKGIIPSDISGSTVHSIKRAFNYLDDAIDAVDGGDCSSDSNHLNTTDLVAANCRLNIACYADSIDNKEAVIDGWTTGNENYIRIFTPVLSSEVGKSQRHKGKWDDNSYRIVVIAIKSYQNCILVRVPNARIQGLQLFIQSDYSSAGAVRYFEQVSGEFNVSNCIAKGYTTSSESKIYGILAYNDNSSESVIKLWNNIIYDFYFPDTTTGQSGIVINVNGCSGIICNNTIYNCRNGIIGWLGGFIVINNIINNAKDGFFNWDTSNTNKDYNVSNVSNDFPGAHSLNGAKVFFVDTLGRDLHIAIDDTLAKDNGMSDPGQGLFTDDIDGQVREGKWDRGADESY